MKAVLLALVLLWPTLALAGHELDDRDLNNGQVMYMQHCASCHGVRLEGQPNWRRPGKDGILPAPPHDATGHTWHHDNRLLFDYTKLGGKALMEARGIAWVESGMPGLGDVMSDDEIWDVLAYIRLHLARPHPKYPGRQKPGARAMTGPLSARPRVPPCTPFARRH